MPNSDILSKFLEAPLNFDPTYKYDPNCNIYDTSQKMRIPAWCDRILYHRTAPNSSNNIKPMYYGRRETTFSDHRPVICFFRVAVKSVDQDKK